MFLEKNILKEADKRDKRKHNLLPASQRIKQFEDWAVLFNSF